MSETVLRRRRGVTRASLTRLTTRLRELETKTDEAGTLDLAQRLEQKLKDLKSDFMTHHLALIDALTDDSALETEQEVLDEHDEEVTQLDVRIQHLIATCSPPQDSNSHKLAHKRLLRLRKNLSESESVLSSDSDDVCMIHQHQEQLSDFKDELIDVRNSLLSLDLKEDDELNKLLIEVERCIFNVSLKIKRLLQTLASAAAGGKGIKLPKLEVPTFDGNILHWRTF